MNVKAKAEEGIVISNEATHSVENPKVWSVSATASHNATVELLPTSTANGTNWYHANAQSATASTPIEGSYSSVTPVVTDGIGRVNIGTSDSPVYSNYYLKNIFYVQSASAGTITLDTKKLCVNNVVATTSTSNSSEINKALRVLFKLGDDVIIVAPVSGATLDYGVNGATFNEGDGPAVTCGASEYLSFDNTSSIPAFKADGENALPVEVYIYFEGEDEALFSANIKTNMDQLSISFKLAIH